MSPSDSNAQPDPLPVTIELHLHWKCPHCEQINSMRLPDELPKFVTCCSCERISRTLVNE